METDHQQTQSTFWLFIALVVSLGTAALAGGSAYVAHRDAENAGTGYRNGTAQTGQPRTEILNYETTVIVFLAAIVIFLAVLVAINRRISYR